MAKRKGRKATRSSRRRPRRGRATGDAERVVGFFASDATNVLCHEDACIITGTSQSMQALLKRPAPRRRSAMTVRKTTFGEIRQGLQWGAAYGFDEQAYQVFRPLAGRAALPLVEQRVMSPDSGALHVVRLQADDEPLGSPSTDPQPAPDVWLDEEGLHVVVPTDAPPEELLDELTRRYQQQIRNSPLWEQMVDEFGAEQAERMLKDFRAESR